MMNIYITHFRKIFYIILFSSAVWFISFSIFPENQVIKIEVGDVSPVSFSAPRFLSVVDEQETQKLKEDARNNVAPVYSIDTKINVSVIDGITEMFLTIIKARTEEVLVTDNETNPENPQSIVETQELSKVEQIEKVQSSLLFSTISTPAVEVLVEKQEDKNGQLVLSHRRARVLRAWENVNVALETGEVVQGYIKR